MKNITKFAIKYLYALMYCFYSFTIGVFFQRNRSFINMVYNYFSKTRKLTDTTKPIIPKVHLSEIASNVPVQIYEPIPVDGNIALHELVVIAILVRLHNPKKLFEIGTFNGRTTLNMAINSAQDAKVYTLDLPKENLNAVNLPLDPNDRKYINKDKPGSLWLGTEWMEKICQLYGDSATFDFTPFFGMDFIFIDGSHSYEYVLNDSRKAIQLLREGKGVILWHDYATEWWEGVTKALNDLYLNDSEFKDLKWIAGTSLVYLFKRA